MTNFLQLSSSARKVRDRILLALRRPDLALRALKGLDVIEIGLDEIQPYLSEAPTILEAGALDGTDTCRLAERWPKGYVHSLEPVPAALDEARINTAHLKNSTLYAFALSSSVGIAELNLSDGVGREYRPDSSSLLQPTGHLEAYPEIQFRQRITVQTETIDSFAKRYEIQQFDFMWLDLQGVEMDVIRSSPIQISKVSVLHLEVSRNEMYAGMSTYKEVKKEMATLGFQVAIDRVANSVGNILFVKSQ